MYLCQQLEQQTDHRYRRDWRAVWFRVSLTPEGKLRWTRHRQGKWRCTFQRRQRVNAVAGFMRTYLAKDRARRDFLKGVPEMPAVYHGKPVTDKEAEKLTGILAPMSRDRLLDADGDLASDVVCNWVSQKYPPTKASALAAKLSHAEKKLAEYDAKLKRTTNLRKKWATRVKRLTTLAAKRAAAQQQ